MRVAKVEGRMDVPAIRAYVRGLKKYLKDYPQKEESAQRFNEEIEKWETVLFNAKYVKHFIFKVSENEDNK